MIDIDTIKEYYEKDQVYATEHASERFRQRGIKARDVRCAVENGEVIEQYPDDYPFPSCLILGYDLKNKPIHVCLSDEGSSSRIITAYYPNSDKWSNDYRTRKEQLWTV